MGTDQKACIQKCLQFAGKYALSDATNGTAYTIPNPQKVRAFDDQEVEVTGTLEQKISPSQRLSRPAPRLPQVGTSN